MIKFNMRKPSISQENNMVFFQRERLETKRNTHLRLNQ